jgi:hypothetical protein
MHNQGRVSDHFRGYTSLHSVLDYRSGPQRRPTMSPITQHCMGAVTRSCAVHVATATATVVVVLRSTVVDGWCSVLTPQPPPPPIANATVVRSVTAVDGHTKSYADATATVLRMAAPWSIAGTKSWPLTMRR